MDWNNYACVRVDKNNITDFIQLLTTHGLPVLPKMRANTEIRLLSLCRKNFLHEHLKYPVA